MKKILQIGIIFFGINTYSQLAGSLDTSFGSGGKIITTFFTGADVAKSVAIQNDGKIIVAGNCENPQGDVDFGIIRYNVDGSIDDQFGNNGKVYYDITTTIATNLNDYPSKILLQANGKIVITGQTNNAQFALIRLNSNGTLDTTFGNNGKVIFFVGGNNVAYNAVMQNDEKIIMVGKGAGQNDSDFAIARINTDGSLDLDFSNDGKLNIDFGIYDEAHGIAIDSDGKIIVCGTKDSTTACMARLNPDGSLDNSFGVNGKAYFTAPGAEFMSIKVQADYKIIVSGIIGNDFLLTRYNPNGTIDNSFGVNGYYTFDIDNMSDDDLNSMIIQNDGKIVLCGRIYTGGQYYFCIVRCNPDGTLDTSFSYDGKQLTSFGTSWSMANDIICQNDGKLVVVGNYGEYFNSDFAIARYLGINNLSTNDFENKSSLNIYPNPVKNILHVNVLNLSANEYQILDLNGRIIFKGKITQEINNISTESLSKGMYILKVENLNTKFIKQ